MTLPLVDLWLLWTGDCSDEIHRDWLSPQERMRGDRYRSPAKRRQFLLSRILSREIISRTLGLPPEQIEWPTTGVPHLRSDARELPLSMSLSHTGEFLALAVSSPDLGLGVDLEVLDSQLRVGPLAGLALTQHERLLLAELPEPEQVRWIQQIWTAKEAVIKSLEQERPPEMSTFDLSELIVSHALTIGELRGVDEREIVFCPIVASFSSQSEENGWEVAISSGAREGTEPGIVGGIAMRFCATGERIPPRGNRRWRVAVADVSSEQSGTGPGGFPKQFRRLQLSFSAE